MKDEPNGILKPKKTLIKFYITGFFIILFLVFLTIIGFFVFYWFSQHQIKIQPPIVLQSPVLIQTKESPELASLKEQLIQTQQKLEVLEASEAARPSDAPIVNRFIQQSDISILKKNNIR